LSRVKCGIMGVKYSIINKCKGLIKVELIQKIIQINLPKIQGLIFKRSIKYSLLPQLFHPNLMFYKNVL